MNLHRLFLKNNECYISGRKMVPKGVMVHSTAVNNPNISRYVGPDDGILGPVSSNNWNQFRPGGRQVCVHAFIGKVKDGSIATYQTLPWNYIGWHSGKGSKDTSANYMGYIGFEICEDDLKHEDYFLAVYKEAVELTAYLCSQYHLDPTKPGVVICHCEGHKLGIASNHADVMHWFPKFGKSMDTFRADVIKTKKEMEDTMTYEEWKSYMDRYTKELAEKGPSAWAVPFIEDAKTAGVADGTRPQSPATREEMFTMLSHYELKSKQ